MATTIELVKQRYLRKLYRTHLTNFYKYNYSKYYDDLYKGFYTFLDVARRLINGHGKRVGYYYEIYRLPKLPESTIQRKRYCKTCISKITNDYVEYKRFVVSTTRGGHEVWCEECLRQPLFQFAIRDYDDNGNERLRFNLTKEESENLPHRPRYYFRRRKC